MNMSSQEGGMHMKNRIYIILIAIFASALLIQTAYVIGLERNQKIFVAKQRLRQRMPYFRLQDDLSMMPNFSVNFIMQELPNEYLVTMYLPGLNKEEISLELKDRYLTVSGGKKIEKDKMGKNYQAREVTSSSFLKVVTLPEDIQKKGIVSEYKGGNLTIHIPKKPQAKKAKLK